VRVGPHTCREAIAALGHEYDKKTEELLAKTSKKCPACGTAIEKTTGCDVMMCGTQAHGSVRDAIRNGG